MAVSGVQSRLTENIDLKKAQKEKEQKEARVVEDEERKAKQTEENAPKARQDGVGSQVDTQA